MPSEIAPRRTRPARRLLLIFVVTILGPGLILGGLGLWAFVQERRAAEQRALKALDVEAANVGRLLELELKEWQQAVDAIARIGPADPALWPARVQTAVADPGTGVVLIGTRERVHAFPVGRLLWELSPEPEASPKVESRALEEAESLELRSKQYEPAIARYRQLVSSREAGIRPAALHLLARTLRKAGRTDEAVRTYRLLSEEPPVRIGLSPSDLLAAFEMIAMTSEERRADAARPLYRDLVAGRWRLDRVTYEGYSHPTRNYIPEDADTQRVATEEAQKMALTLAAEHVVASPGTSFLDADSATLSFTSEAPFAAIVLGPPYVRTRLLPIMNRADVKVTLLAPDGEVLVGDVAQDGEESGSYTLQGAPRLRLEVRPTDRAALDAGLSRQQNLFIAMLAVLVALLGFGGYLTIHTLRRELAVAQMKSDFVSTVSHEFRSPLAGINQLGEMLRDGRVSEDDRRQEYYGMIVNETQRLRRLVENVLDFARMEDGRKQYRFEPVEPVGWLQEVAEDFQGQVAGRGFAVEARVPTALPAIVGDRETLTTAVQNLLDNAVKYSGDSRTVRLEACANNGSLSISVRDGGIGIREEDRPRIFEKFYRGGGELARRVKGVGLGLNLVQHIVLAHGGTIEVESREGEGSTFTIHLKTGNDAQRRAGPFGPASQPT